MPFSPATLALLKLGLTFGIILTAMKIRLDLWLAILAGSFTVAIICSMPILNWATLILQTATQNDLLLLLAMVFLILTLSSVQDATGQSNRLVQGIEQCLKHPRLRLVLFPTIIGLLPMPGGALFSCPMLNSAAKGMDLSPKEKTLINYWFRHIWELASPLYPGYILASGLLGLPLSTLAYYTAILVPLAFIVGWFFYMRNLVPLTQSPTAPPKAGVYKNIAFESLPLVIAIAGAGFFSWIFAVILPSAPSQFAFIASVTCAIIIAFWQGHKYLERSLSSLIFSRNSLQILLLIFAIFVFKNTIMESGLVTDISTMSGSKYVIYSLFIILPLIGGILTGVMVGYVGSTFPILISITSQMNLQEEALPLYILALVSGNCGQLLSPLHICLVVSCNYFLVPIAQVWKDVLMPVIIQLIYGILLALFLYYIGANFGPFTP